MKRLYLFKTDTSHAALEAYMRRKYGLLTKTRRKTLSGEKSSMFYQTGKLQPSRTGSENTRKWKSLVVIVEPIMLPLREKPLPKRSR